MKFFDEVKSLLTMDAVARHYGYAPNRAGMIRCPFHNDKNPSMRLYDRNFHCFGCGAHGDVIDFVSRVFGLSALEAARMLNKDFSLGLSGEPPDLNKQRERQREREAARLFEEWRTQMLNQLDAAIRVANRADLERLSDAEALALRYRESLIYWADFLMHGNLDNQMKIFCDREGVNRICKRILSSTPTTFSAAWPYMVATA